MTSKKCLEAAAAIRRDARKLWFLASGATPAHAALVAAACELERAAQELARAENKKQFGDSLAAYQRKGA